MKVDKQQLQQPSGGVGDGLSPRVACVILNWNGYVDTVACLKALRRIPYADLRAIVVDNGSTDNSVEEILRSFPNVTLLTTGANLGFSGGNNVGIRHALGKGADYIWLLNNDTEPTPEALERLVAIAESDSSVGAVGSIMTYASQPDEVQMWGGGRLNIWTGASWFATSPKPISWFSWLCAASMLVRSTAFETIGYLDEQFFLYWEDVDFGVRLTKAGWKLAIASSSIVLHKVSASTGGKNAKFERYSTTSAIKFLSKHSPLGWITVCFFLVSRSLKRIASGEPKRVVNIYRGICDYLGARQSSNLFDHVAAGSRVAGQQGVQTHSESQRLRDDSSTPVAAKM